MTIIWQTSGDNPCPRCRKLNGRNCAVVGVPPLHPNCQCVAIDTTDTGGFINLGQVRPFQTHDQLMRRKR